MEILVVEDNEVNQKLIVRILKSFGYGSTIAENGVLALSTLRQRFYPIVLMDIQMPEMDGLEATKRIREDFPSDQQPVIIAVTANALQGDREKYLEAGMDDYISKPLNIAEVKATLQRWAEKITHQQESTIMEAPAGIDPAIITRMRELEQETDREFVKEMIDMFLGDSKGHVDKVFSGIQSKDCKTIVISVHTLKGSGLNLGAREFGTLCKQLEEMGRSERLDLLESEMEHFRSVYARTCEQMIAYKESLA